MLAQFPEGSVDLIYVDPPFFSNRQYEVLWGDGYELRAFEDRWRGGIENYIAWMEDKIRECHRVLKDTGSMYLHCDWQIKSELKFMVVKEAMKVKIKTSEIAYEIMRTEAKIDRECGWVLHVNGGLDLIEKELVSMGTVEGAFMHPREIFKKAIVNGSSSIIIVHNHPSGDPTPSQEDKDITKRLKEAGGLLGLPVNDFIIIGSRGYFSFADEKIGGV